MMFLAFDASIRPASAPKEVSTLLESLSPRLMEVGDQLWLVDLKPCLSYWQHQAQERQTPVEDLWRRLLATDAVDPDGYRASVAAGPWQALLLVLTLRERHMSGLTVAYLPLGKKLYQDTSWDVWRQAAHLIEPHLARDAKRFDAAAYKRRLAQMRRALSRLAIKTPRHFYSATPLSLRRRFGPHIGDLWAWTLDQTEPAFPWLSVSIASPPQVSRHLDYPVMQWAELEAFLREDFNRLCRHEVSPGRRGILPEQRVLAFTWTLTRDDLSSVALTITFRHPHPIHKDVPAQKTAILQALYAFESLQKPADQDDIPSSLIVGWQLGVKSWLRTLPFNGSLFRDDSGEGEDMAQLAALENLLAMPLRRVRACADFVPEDSFDGGPTLKAFAGHDGGGTNEHHAVAVTRPLFIWDKPRLWDGAHDAKTMKFLERVSDKWWRHPGRRQRDYFRITDRYGKDLWAFQDHLGRWFLHGLYA